MAFSEILTVKVLCQIAGGRGGGDGGNMTAWFARDVRISSVYGLKTIPAFGQGTLHFLVLAVSETEITRHTT